MGTKILMLFLAVTLVVAFPPFRSHIPNGFRVPSPCDPDDIWPAVGHYNATSGLQLNPFGVVKYRDQTDFESSFYQWTTTLCNLDSDGDGRTNGEELGDPQCQFTEGRPGNLGNATGHPGICEPLDSTLCKNLTLTLDIPKFCDN